MRQLMEERVLIPEGSMLAKTAYIYNGLEDMDLKYAGRVFPIKKGAVTEVPVFQWREVDEMNGARILYSLEGEAVARELVEKHDWDKAGIQVFIKQHTQFDKDGTAFEVGLNETQIEALKVRCDELGRQYKLSKIETFRKEREMGRAGIHGHRIHPTEKEIRWMKEMNISDELFNPSNDKNDTRDMLLQTIERQAQQQAEMQKQMIGLMERIAMPSSAENQAHKALGPRRKSGESIEKWQARVVEWKKTMAEVEAAEMAASETVETEA